MEIFVGNVAAFSHGVHGKLAGHTNKLCERGETRFNLAAKFESREFLQFPWRSPVVSDLPKFASMPNILIQYEAITVSALACTPTNGTWDVHSIAFFALQSCLV